MIYNGVNMQRKFDNVIESGELEFDKVCGRLDCNSKSDWICKIRDKTFYLCRLHFNMYNYVYESRITAHQDELLAYLNKENIATSTDIIIKNSKV